MKITRSQLKKIIKEEIQKELSEQDYTSMYGGQRSYDPGMSMARQTPASPEDLEVGKVDVVGEPMKIKGFPVRMETMMMQAMLNLALDKLGNPLPDLKIDGKSGPKTRRAARLVRRKLKRGETLMSGLTRITGMNREDLKDHALQIVADMTGMDAMTDIAGTVDDLTKDKSRMQQMATPPMTDDQRLQQMMRKAKKPGKVTPIKAPTTTFKRKKF
tara:strand:+ start:986 stop:1630 length:645 start_codon:yes stop_codon:yes gene_type:complete